MTFAPAKICLTPALLGVSQLLGCDLGKAECHDPGKVRAGCEDSGEDSDRAAVVPPRFIRWSVHCEEQTCFWRTRVEGQATRVDLEVVEYGDEVDCVLECSNWVERHPLRLIDAPGDWGVDLVVVPLVAEQRDGESTLFNSTHSIHVTATRAPVRSRRERAASMGTLRTLQDMVFPANPMAYWA